MADSKFDDYSLENLLTTTDKGTYCLDVRPSRISQISFQIWRARWRTSFNVDLNLFDEFYLSDLLNTLWLDIQPSGWVVRNIFSLFVEIRLTIKSNRIHVFKFAFVIDL